MDARSSLNPSDGILASLEQQLGARKSRDCRIGEDDWKRVFDAVSSMKEPRGWVVAVSTWTGASTWTVSDRWKKHDTSIHQLGRPPYVPPALEASFGERIVERAIIGNGMKPREVRAGLRAIVAAECDTPAGGRKGHLRGFMHRHPKLTDRVAEVTKSTRILGPTRKGHDDMFDNLAAVGLADAVPSMVINIDESDSQAKRSHVRVIGPRYNIIKRISVPDGSVSMHISLVAATRANGLPYGKPIFILSGARVSADAVEDTDEYLVICTKSGGMEGYAWEECCTYWASIAKGGEIFIVDGHSSHEDYLANDVMAKKGLKVVTLDPHCTHIYQVSIDDLRCGAAAIAVHDPSVSKDHSVCKIYLRYLRAVALGSRAAMQGRDWRTLHYFPITSLPRNTLCSPWTRHSSVLGTRGP